MTNFETQLLGIVGSWSGRGRGVYPTIEPFEYLERLTFTQTPKGFLIYQQSTTHVHTGISMHTESGYVRPSSSSNTIEMVIAQPTGIVEVLSGVVRAHASAFTISLRSDMVGATASAKQVEAVSRDITVTGDHLTYEVCMAAVGQALQLHLSGELRRDS